MEWWKTHYIWLGKLKHPYIITLDKAFEIFEKCNGDVESAFPLEMVEQGYPEFHHLNFGDFVDWLKKRKGYIIY